MNRSENIAELAAALAKAQAVMKPAKKDSSNPFFKSQYADLPSVVEAAKKPLADNGLSFVQVTDFADGVSWVETVLMHASGQWISGRYPVKPVKDDPQGMGSALTYSRRYGLAALVGIVAADEDDDGNAASQHPIERSNGTGEHLGGNSTPKADPGAAAKKWAKEAETAVKACVTTEELTAWEDKNKNALVKLHGVDLKAHERLMELVVDRYARVNVLAA